MKQTNYTMLMTINNNDINNNHDNNNINKIIWSERKWRLPSLRGSRIFYVHAFVCQLTLCVGWNSIILPCVYEDWQANLQEPQLGSS